MRSLWYGLPTRNVHWIVGSKGSESLPTHTQLLATEGSVSASFTSGLLFWFITLGSSENQRLNAGGVWLRHPKSGLYSGGSHPCASLWISGLKVNPQHFLSKYPLFFENSSKAVFISHVFQSFEQRVYIQDAERGHGHFGLLTWVILTSKPSNQPWLPGKTTFPVFRLFQLLAAA